MQTQVRPFASKLCILKNEVLLFCFVAYKGYLKMFLSLFNDWKLHLCELIIHITSNTYPHHSLVLLNMKKRSELTRSGILSFSTGQLKQDFLSYRYQLVVQTTTEERRKVGNNLQCLLEMVATHVGSVEVSVGRSFLHSKKVFQAFVYFNFVSTKIKW